MPKVLGEFKGDVQLRRLKPPVKGQAYFKDAGSTGLYMVANAGGRRSWVVRIKGHGEKTIGRYHADGGMSLTDARAATEEARKRAKNGLEPFPSDEDSRFPEVWKRFETAHVANLGYRSGEVYKSLRRRIGHRWDKRVVSTITDDEIDVLLMEVRDGAASSARGGNGAAAHNNAYSSLKVFFRYCWQRRLVDDMPMARMTLPNKQSRRERVLSPDELVSIWNALEPENFPHPQRVRLAMLVPVRIWSEAATISRKDVTDGIWRYRVPKTGIDQALRLPQMALDILNECPDTGLLFFHKAAPHGAQVGLKRRLDSRIEVEDWQFHDFRTAFMTHLRDLGVPFDIADQIQRPIDNSSTGARHYDLSERVEEKGEVLDYWAYAMRQWLAGRSDVLRWRAWLRGADVVPLERTA